MALRKLSEPSAVSLAAGAVLLVPTATYVTRASETLKSASRRRFLPTFVSVAVAIAAPY
jgi:hypothetical protein